MVLYERPEKNQTVTKKSLESVGYDSASFCHHLTTNWRDSIVDYLHSDAEKQAIYAKHQAL